MSVTSQTEIMHLANRLELRIMHFAYGTYPVAGETAALPRNRFFMPEKGMGPECFIADENDHFPLRTGYAYFIPAYHDAQVRLSDDLTFLSIQFRLELWDGVDIFSHVTKMQPIREPSFLERGLTAFRAESSLTASLALRSLVMDFCRAVISRTVPEELDLGTRFSRYQREIEYLNQNIRADTTVEALADLHGVRRETFTRKFREETGVTPKQFITRMLFHRASEMLLQTDLPVKTVAVRLGFSTEYYFSDFFRKQSGLPPGKFRTQYR